MKVKVSERQLKQNYGKKMIWCCGYCELSRFRNTAEPDYYISGIYGWNCDCYKVGNILICTGYRPPSGCRTIPRELLDSASSIADLAKRICDLMNKRENS